MGWSLLSSGSNAVVSRQVSSPHRRRALCYAAPREMLAEVTRSLQADLDQALAGA